MPTRPIIFRGRIAPGSSDIAPTATARPFAPFNPERCTSPEITILSSDPIRWRSKQSWTFPSTATGTINNIAAPNFGPLAYNQGGCRFGELTYSGLPSELKYDSRHIGPIIVATQYNTIWDIDPICFSGGATFFTVALSETTPGQIDLQVNAEVTAVFVDGSLFYCHQQVLQCRADGAVFTPPLVPLVPFDPNGATISRKDENNVTHQVTKQTNLHEAKFSLPKTTQHVDFRFTNQWGETSEWFKLKPIPYLTGVVSFPGLTEDLGGDFSSDTTRFRAYFGNLNVATDAANQPPIIVFGDQLYHWTIFALNGGVSTIIQEVTTTEPYIDFDHTDLTDDEIRATVRIESGYGCVATATGGRPLLGGDIDALVDPMSNAIYTVHAANGGTQVTRFNRADNASKTDLVNLPNTRPLSIARLSDGAFVVGATDKSDSRAYLYRSEDSLKTPPVKM
jgi:hypothetical protein